MEEHTSLLTFAIVRVLLYRLQSTINPLPAVLYQVKVHQMGQPAKVCHLALAPR
jgi:hypothetical protein